MLQIPKQDPRDGDEKGKLFVGGLSWDTCNASLLKYFMRYGEVIDCVVMKNPQTGKSRGFGFIKFRDPSVLDVVLASAPHVIDGRQVDPKACNPRSMNKVGGKSAEKNKNKIFMGGLPTNATEDQVREVFEQFGPVTDIVIMFDQEKQKSRGFGFLSYDTEESVNRVCQQQYVEVAGKKIEPWHRPDDKPLSEPVMVECKRAEPRDPKQVAATGGSSGMIMTQNGLVPASALGLAGFNIPGHPLVQSTMPGVALMPMPSSVIPFAPLNSGIQSPLQSPVAAAGAGSLVGAGALSGAGALMGAGTLPAGALTSGWTQAGLATDTEGGWTPVSSPMQYAASSAAALTTSSVNGSSGYSQMLGVETSQGQERVLPAAYLSSGQAGPQAVGDSEGKAPYYIPGSLGMFGSYPQEASSYGPARVLAPEMKLQGPMTGLVSPYSGSFAYTTSPGMAPLPSAYGPLGSLTGLVPFGYGGHGDAPAYATALPTRTLTAAQGFHPYRRGDDNR